MYPWNKEETTGSTMNTMKDTNSATNRNTPLPSSRSILMTRRASNPTSIWKRPQICIHPENTNNVKRRRTSYKIRMEDMNTTSTRNTSTNLFEFSTYLSSSSSSSLSYSSSFSSIVPCTNSPNDQENDDMISNLTDDNNQTLSQDMIGNVTKNPSIGINTTDATKNPKCWWHSKSTMSSTIMTTTTATPRMNKESDSLNTVSCCCVCRNVLLPCTDTTCNTNLNMPTSKSTRTLWNYWKPEDNCQSHTMTQDLPSPPPVSSSPSSLWEFDVSTRTNRRRLQCTYCDRPVCSSCCQSCDECQDLVCSNCSRLDYENYEERMLCGKCFDSCVTIEPKYSQEAEDMDWDL